MGPDPQRQVASTGAKLHAGRVSLGASCVESMGKKDTAARVWFGWGGIAYVESSQNRTAK